MDSILGPEEMEAEWFKFPGSAYNHDALNAMITAGSPKLKGGEVDEDVDASGLVLGSGSGSGCGRLSKGGEQGDGPLVRVNGLGSRVASVIPVAAPKPVAATGTAVNKVAQITGSVMPLAFLAEEKQKEKMMAVTGDICGGRGGELGRRLEAWLSVTGGNGNGVVEAGEEQEPIDVSENVDTRVGIAGR